MTSPAPGWLSITCVKLVAAQAAAARGAALEVIDTPALTVLEGRAVGERLAARPPADRPDGFSRSSS